MSSRRGPSIQIPEFPFYCNPIVIIGFSVVLGVLVQFPHLFGSRVHDNLDFAFHYNYAREYAEAFKLGDYWPRWAHSAWNGRGEPGLLFYSPLYYWLSAAVSGLTGNSWMAMQIVEIASAAVAAGFSYALASDYAGRRAGLLAIPLVVLSPMVTQLHHGFNGFPWATAIAPLSALQWAMLRRTLPDMLLNPIAILALAATILTHTITGLMALIMVCSLAIPPILKLLAGGRPGTALYQPVSTAIFGLLLSSVYLLPAMGLRGEIDNQIWLRDYSPFNSFALPTVTAMTHGMRWFAFQWPISGLIIASCGVALLALRKSDVPIAAKRGFLAAFGVAALLSTELSLPVWAVSSPLLNVQFPYRFVTVLTPMAAVLLAIAIGKSGQKKRLVRVALFGLAAANIGFGTLIVAKAMVMDGATVDTSETRFETYPGHEEYRTRFAMAANSATNAAIPQDACLRGDFVCTRPAREGRSMVWQVDVAKAGAIRLPLHYFPSWTAKLDGNATRVSADEGTGLSKIPMGVGHHTVTLLWSALPIERLGAGFSLIALLLLALFWLLPLFRSARRHMIAPTA